MTHQIHIGILVMAAVGCSLTSGAQFNPPNGPLYQERAEKEAYFEQRRATMTDEEFYHEGGEYAEYQKFLKQWEHRLSPHGDMSIYDQLLGAYDARQAQGAGGSGFRSNNNDPWLELGPKRRTNNMVGIGPIRKLSINRVDHEHMLCSSTSGGLFYTTNAGDDWYNANTDVAWTHSGCQAHAYYPGSTESWYAISAVELFQRNKLAYIGGVYRTSDSGGTWEKMGDQGNFAGPETETEKLLFDEELNAQNDHRLFLASSSGLYVCDDPSYSDSDPSTIDPTWTLLNISTLAPGIIVPPSITALYSNATVEPVVKCYDIEYLPLAGSRTLCASMRFKVTHTVGSNTVATNVWRFMISTDNGDSWNEIANQPQIDATITFATVETSAAAENSFYCLALKSSSWVEAYDVVTEIWTPMASGFSTGYGAGNGFGVDQVDAGSVFVSHQTGMRWYLNGMLPITVANGHADVEDIVAHPTNQNEIWVANHGGVSKVEPGGSPPWVDRSNGLGVGEVDAMSTSETHPQYIVTGLFHDHTTLTRTPYSSDWDPDWDAFDIGGDGTRCWVSRQDPNTVYMSYYDGNWKRSDAAETSNATTGIYLASEWWSEGALDRLDEDRLFRITKKNNGPPQTYYTTDGNGNTVATTFQNSEIELVRSEDRGVSNTIISDFTNIPEISAGAVVINNYLYKNDAEKFFWVRTTPANPDHLYVGLHNYAYDTRIFRNTACRASNVEYVKTQWEEVPHPRRAPVEANDPDREPSVSSIAFDSENENIIYIAYAGSLPFDGMGPEETAERMVYRMDLTNMGAYPTQGKFDCGGQFDCSDITMNLPNTVTDMDGLVFEQGSDGGLYISTGAGVYFTNNERIAAFDPQDPQGPPDPDGLDNTTGWVRLGDALPHVASRGLEINYVINRIRVGTHGRGVWEHHLQCPDREDYAESGTYSADAYLEALHSISSTAVLSAGLNVNYRAGDEVRMTPGFHATAGVQYHAFIHPCDVPGNSFHPKNMTSAGAAATEVQALRNDQSLSLYPNPASKSLSLLLSSTANEGYARVRFYDTTGRQVVESRMKGSLAVLDVSDLRGFFTVVVETDDARYVERVVIE
jgi:hypothetical protein